MTVIELTESDIVKFKAFMQHYDLFSLLLEHGVFDQKSATIALHFDHNGTLKTIERKDFLYYPKPATLGKA